MKHLFPILFVLLVTLSLGPQPTMAQQVDSAKDRDAEAALREKAFATLESLANQSSTLQSAENRARINANIVGSLWRHDEKRARALFQLVKDDIKLGLKPRVGYGYGKTLEVFLKLREDTARRMGKLDAELALEFFRETFLVVKEELTFSDGKLRPDVAAKEKSLELELARALVRKNPEDALKVAQTSMARGFDPGLILLLLRLSDKHPADARLLYKTIVSKIGATDLRDDDRALEFSRKLVHNFPPPAADEATYRDLLEILLKTAIAAGCAEPQSPGPPVCYTIGYTVPQMERFFPTRTARLERWLPDYPRPEFDTYGDVQYQIEEFMEDGTADDILALASRYPEHADMISYHAMLKAESVGDLERAKKIANNFPGDSEVRERLVERLQRYEVNAAKAEALLAQVRQSLEFVPVRDQIDGLLRVANHLAPNDPQISIKVLAQVSGMIDELKPSEQILTQMVMAIVYSLAKSDQGFALMKGMVPKLNELITAAAKLDGFETNYLRNGEWNMSAEGEIGKLLTFLSSYAGHFAWHDYDRAMNLAAQFERAEVRMMAQLKLAQGILSGRPARFDIGPMF